MGLFQRKPNRNPTSGPLFGVLLVVLLLTTIFLFEVDNLATQTKTIIGHNLKPTPWHEFPPKEFNNETKIARASKIIQCSYFSCGMRSYNDKVPFTSKADRCPGFFRWIHHDLEPWYETRISYDHLMEVKKFASFRVVIIGGKLYVEYYFDCVQSRAMFTVWGILQLLKRYPGRVPDVDLMFDCMDKPIIERRAVKPLPIFRYCTTPNHYDIPFPDWSFWGWSDINIGPWEEEFQSIKEGSQKQSWRKKYPYAYWKGNPDVNSPIREALLQCNDTTQWGALIMRQNWAQEIRDGFKQSKLSAQCNHRYKIYAEGYAWSVSLKYILSCGCVPLIINPKYDDFFSRGLFPKKDYLPISPENICPSIKTAVQWGNAHPAQAEAIGKSVQDFMEESLNIDRIYDYMYHLIVEYAELLDFKPVRPASALEECVESLYCFADQSQANFLARSAALPSQTPPCKLPAPANRKIDKMIEEKKKIIDSTQLLM